MALSTPWILLVVVGVAIAAVAAGLLWGGRSSRAAAPDPAFVARAERLRRLPSVRRATRLRVLALSAVLVLGACSAVAAGVVAARPLAAQTIVPENHSRDVMLCLDVSGSMNDVDVEILDVFGELTSGFDGERIGLTIFNSSPVQVFPLTDDYDFVARHLSGLRESIEQGTAGGEIPEHWVGTLDGPGSSLIGDGLAACALRFDHADDERSRSVILATDNETVGDTIVTLAEAAAYSAERGIRVFALNPIQDGESEPSRRLAQAVAETGGAAYALRGETTVGDIIAEIETQEARALTARAEVVRTDAPAPWILILLVAGLAAVVIAWRARA
ncbi:vWA domain-containing protein [Microbacterium karelineae]|uniref:vWA domain-containing protein n=1 Tax=Microbacterium karelineae TaxID=2654283 RepID=UPI001E4D6591|nr:VWA domain-containing protein [Microbacterium karelineae]